jgi:hypothetical protein
MASGMAFKRRPPHGLPMDLRNMRHLGVRGLAVHCLSQNCRHEIVFSADDYPDEVEVASFQSRMKCNECGGKNVDVRPNWKEQPVQMRLTGKVWR